MSSQSPLSQQVPTSNSP